MRCALVLLAALAHSAAFGMTPDALWHTWPDARFVHAPAPCLRHAELVEHLDRLAARYPDTVSVETVGTSVEGRSINLVTIGTGPMTVLLWSQMHGDEPSATPALLDLAAFVASRRDDPAVTAMLDRYTLLMVPMLNPDGAEAFQRRNAQGIDVNRDARHLATPEGRVLKALRDRFRPIIGFNLHDQSTRTTVGDTGLPATIAVLAVSGDSEQTMTEGRERARRACSAIVDALRPFIGGHLARFNENWNPRAFGDRITAWGTPVILIESGGLPRDTDPSILVRLNFVAMATVLFEMADNDLRDFGPQPYESLPRTRRRGLADVIVPGGMVLPRGSDRAFRADVAFNVGDDGRSLAACESEIRSPSSSIVEIGDAGHLGARTVIDAQDALIVEPWTVGVEGWAARTWLDDAHLDRLARLGVGRVVWSVPEPDAGQARLRADDLNGRSPIPLDLQAEPLEDGFPVLRAPVPAIHSKALGVILGALTGRSANDPPLTETELIALIEAMGPPEGPSHLQVGRPATFLLLHPAPNGHIDPARTELTSVFINGTPLAGGPRHADQPTP